MRVHMFNTFLCMLVYSAQRISLPFASVSREVNVPSYTQHCFGFALVLLVAVFATFSAVLPSFLCWRAETRRIHIPQAKAEMV